MKKFVISYSSLLFNFLVGGILAFAFKLGSGFDFNPLVGGPIAVLLAVLISLYTLYSGNDFIARNVFTAGLLKEIWISRLMELFYPTAPWLARAQDFSGNVEYNTINLADIGADPVVLVNNTSYPIPFTDRTDVPLALPLDYYDTTGSVVRNAEQAQLAYNKMDSTVKQHGKALAKTQSAKAAWNFAPQANGSFTPVLPTLGNPKASYAVGARLPFSFRNIIAAAAAFDAIDAPTDNRILVLCTQHKQDLLNEDVNLFKGFTDYKTGMIGQLYGFDIYVSTQTPKYNNTNNTKNTYGAAPAGTDAVASFFFQADEVMRACGTMDMFSRLRDPEARGDIVGFQQRFIALSIRGKLSGAVVDTITAVAQPGQA
jgi:hypothetical protein